jgi:hypothetical protein
MNAVSGIPAGVAPVADSLNSSSSPVEAAKSATSSASAGPISAMGAAAASGLGAVTDALASLDIFNVPTRESIEAQATELNNLIASGGV